MDLSILIALLLKDNETVIIPGFGAFVSVYKPAVIKENEIIPPRKELRFFHQIKNNDGLIAMHIARSKKISFDDAFKRIEKATSKIVYQLDKGEKIVFGELGEFSYNENSEIVFTQYETGNPLIIDGFEPVSLEDVTETPEEVTVEQLTAPVTEVVEEVSNTDGNTIGEQLVVTEEEPAQLIDSEKEKPESAPVVNLETPVVKPAKAEEPRKKNNAVWIWILLVIAVVVIAIFILLNKNDEQQTGADSKIQTQKAETAQPAAITPDTIQPSDTVNVEVSQPQTNTSSEKYYLVGGGFSNEENAMKYINQLKEKGIEGILLGQKGKLFIVGIASFNSESEAYNELNRRMRENPDWKLWVYKK